MLNHIFFRIKIGGYNVSSPPFDYGRYKSIVHHHNQERQGLRRCCLCYTVPSGVRDLLAFWEGGGKGLVNE